MSSFGGKTLVCSVRRGAAMLKRFVSGGARRRACPRDASAAACAARGAPWRRARPSDGVELISPSRLRYRRVGGAAGAGVRPRKDCGCGRAWGSHPEAIRVGSARRRACPRDASAAACAARGAPWRRARPSDCVELISPSRLRRRRVGGAGGAGVRSRNDRGRSVGRGGATLKQSALAARDGVLARATPLQQRARAAGHHGAERALALFKSYRYLATPGLAASAVLVPVAIVLYQSS